MKTFWKWIVVMVAQPYECHWIVHLKVVKMVSFMGCYSSTIENPKTSQQHHVTTLSAAHNCFSDTKISPEFRTESPTFPKWTKTSCSRPWNLQTTDSKPRTRQGMIRYRRKKELLAIVSFLAGRTTQPQAPHLQTGCAENRVRKPRRSDVHQWHMFQQNFS